MVPFSPAEVGYKGVVAATAQALESTQSPVIQPLPQHAPLWTHEQWMQRLLRHSQRVGASGEIPVAAVVLDEAGRCIGWGSNRREAHADPLGHAELVALGQAARLRGDWRFNGCTLLVSLEPCPMCAGALVQARMGTVVFGALDPKRGALGSCHNLATAVSAHHHMRVIGGVLGEPAGLQLAAWFRQRRQQGLRRDGRPAARFRTD
ncbi:nucleoside deaminase [Cyanobium sp. Aljojuca 7D2]|jgi:tRNA(adenine34) deaminase|nr:nucleoside deaminase [Cyanobium sp. Aljojuca 7D2]